MLPTTIIVFREAMEAGLIVGIVLAATAGVPGRLRMVLTGVAVGAGGAAVLACFAGTIGNAFDGAGQEILNAAILALAVLMLTWHVVWMSRHGRQMAVELRDVGGAVRTGRRKLSALGIVVAVAVLREGFEVVLFLYGIAVGGGASWGGMLVGGLIGVALAVGLTWLTYAGLVRLPVHRLFTVTGWLVTLLACGLAAQAAAFLQQGGVWTAFGGTVWDSSAILPADSLFGRVLHTLIGYSDRPSELEVAVYLATLATILLLSMAERRTRGSRRA